VRSNREVKSVSAERTFNDDLRDPALLAAELERVAGYAWERAERAGVRGRTVMLKVKYADFTLITRSRSLTAPVADLIAFRESGQRLLDALLPVPKGVRLLGLGLHNLTDSATACDPQLGFAI
jgi:DNA polymerase-4